MIDDDLDDLRADTRRWRPPAWYNATLVPCRCNSTNQTMHSAPAPSDGALLRVKCDNCGREWCILLEG